MKKRWLNILEKENHYDFIDIEIINEFYNNFINNFGIDIYRDENKFSELLKNDYKNRYDNFIYNNKIKKILNEDNDMIYDENLNDRKNNFQIEKINQFELFNINLKSSLKSNNSSNHNNSIIKHLSTKSFENSSQDNFKELLKEQINLKNNEENINISDIKLKSINNNNHNNNKNNEIIKHKITMVTHSDSNSNITINSIKTEDITESYEESFSSN
jgi:hypothetical protein